MAHRVHRAFRLCLALASAALCPLTAAAQTADSFNTSAGNLIVVLRESRGSNKQDESLEPFGKFQVRLDDGREIDVETSWFHYLGDMHIRLVFDGVRSMQSASPDDLLRLRLSPDAALKLAIANLRRVYGRPTVQPWSGGLMQVQGGAPELNSSYFLDREFWQGQQAQYPEGMVVAVPRRGGLVYAPVSDGAAVASLRFGAAALYAGSGGTGISSALYLFKDSHWSVFEPPLAR